MPLKLIFDNLIIPIHIIEEKYEGGFHEFYSLIRNEVHYFDEHLFTISSMSFEMLFYNVIEILNSKGLNCYQLDKDKNIIWKDAYITDRGFGRKYSKPEWASYASHLEKESMGIIDKDTGKELIYSHNYQSVYLTGTNPGKKVTDKLHGEIFSSENVVSDNKPGEFMIKFKNNMENNNEK